MEYALLLTILGAVAVGTTSAVVTTWRLRVTLLELSDRVNVLEGITNREVKVRAAAERWKKPDKDLELLQAMAQQVPGTKKNWWEVLPKTGK